jgi:hypothetical protein
VPYRTFAQYARAVDNQFRIRARHYGEKALKTATPEYNDSCKQPLQTVNFLMDQLRGGLPHPKIKNSGQL